MDKTIWLIEATPPMAVAMMRSGRTAEAIHEFEAALPILRLETQQIADDGVGITAAAEIRLRFIAENYIKLLAATPTGTDEVAERTFAAAESARGRAVQKALTEYGARVAANDPDLAELVRRRQNLNKQIRAQFGLLNNVLSVPSDQRDKKILHDTEDSITQLRADLEAASTELHERFPTYDDLVNPKPPTLDEMRAALRENEAMLSFYFGQNGSFVWAVPKSGPVAFAAVNGRIGDIETRIRKLREALEPQAAMISDIPPFDLKLGYELYELLLKPVESGWKPAKNLIAVTNGALGLLPLLLLPTAPAEVAVEEDPLFAGYRNVPRLTRTHAVSTVPSAAALRTLRQLPPGKPGRGDLEAFGDPYFNRDQQAEAEGADGKLQVADVGGNVTRGMPLKRRSSPKLEGVDSAELGLLPRLPDTADELKSSPHSRSHSCRGTAPSRDPPARPARSCRAILGLKLNADWVILSACNTGAGAGAGAEATSGLGRAFFYAGTRALLVTNWSVHSQSARQLVTDLFLP